MRCMLKGETCRKMNSLKIRGIATAMTETSENNRLRSINFDFSIIKYQTDTLCDILSAVYCKIPSIVLVKKIENNSVVGEGMDNSI